MQGCSGRLLITSHEGRVSDEGKFLVLRSGNGNCLMDGAGEHAETLLKIDVVGEDGSVEGMLMIPTRKVVEGRVASCRRWKLCWKRIGSDCLQKVQKLLQKADSVEPLDEIRG
jgi:hypothetical protein